MIARTAASDRRPGRPRARRRKVGVWLAVVLLAVPLLSGWYLAHRITSRLDRIDGVFAGLPDRPARPRGSEPGAGAVNILVAVTEHRDRWPEDPRRDPSAAAMLLHFSADRRSAVVVALPSECWATPTGSPPSAVVGAVERATDIRLDHVAVVDWEEFSELADLVGGVEMEVPEPVRSEVSGNVWQPGLRYFTGAAALDYVRARPGLPGAEVAAERRQQVFLDEVLHRSLHQEMARDPLMLYRFLDSVAAHSTVDAGWSTLAMARLVGSLRHLRTADLVFVVPPEPYDGPASPAAGRGRALPSASFWTQVRTDRLSP